MPTRRPNFTAFDTAFSSRDMGSRRTATRRKTPTPRVSILDRPTRTPLTRYD